jgi:hypothetical protein
MPAKNRYMPLENITLTSMSPWKLEAHLYVTTPSVPKYNHLLTFSGLV